MTDRLWGFILRVMAWTEIIIVKFHLFPKTSSEERLRYEQTYGRTLEEMWTEYGVPEKVKEKLRRQIEME